jgi:adenylate cyclase
VRPDISPTGERVVAGFSATLSFVLRKTLIGLGLGFGAVLVALGLGSLPFVQTVELKSYDWRMRVTADPSTARKDIVLVEVDENSLQKLAPVVGRWPWPRLVHAQLLNFLARAHPKAVLYDVQFTEPDRRRFTVGDQEWTGAESDEELADAVKQLGVAVMIGNAVPEAPASGAPPAVPDLPGVRFNLDPSMEPRPVFIPPIPSLVAASRAIAHQFVVLDSDGPLRRYVPVIRVGDRYIPALAVAGAAIALDLKSSDVRLDDDGLWLGSRHMPLIREKMPTFDGSTRASRRALVDFPGVWPGGKRTYDTYSFYQLFYAEQQILAGQTPVVDPATFDGKVIVVGASAAGLDGVDVFTVPLPGKMSGAEMHAAVVDDILSNRFLDRARPWQGRILAVLAGLIPALVGVLVGPWMAVGTAGLMAAGLVGGMTWMFARGIWLPLVNPLVALSLATVGGITYQYMVEGREKRRVKRLFSRYVSKDVYSQLMTSPDDVRLGGARRTMSVLFSDIRGFTTVSEQGEPEAIVSQLNQYFSAMVPIVFANKGTVDKFVGDMVMALFGAPLDDPDHADHAVRAALAMTEELARLNSQWAADGWPTLDIGIGINTGDMVAGNLGSESIMSYTVIGDNVNLGARLESLTRNFQTRIIISDATRRALKGSYDTRALGAVTVKGKTQPVQVFEVVIPPAVAAVMNVYSPLTTKDAVAPQRKVQES